MKKLNFAILIVLTSVTGFCNYGDDPGRIGVNFYGGLTHYNFKDFNVFADSYNRYYGGQLTRPMGKLGNYFSYGGNFAIVMEPLLWEIGYKTFTAHQNSEFQNGAKQLIQFTDRLFCFNMGLGGTTEKYAIHGYFPIEVSSSYIIAQFQYPDGSISSGVEQPLSGNYSAIIYPRFGLGLRVERWFGYFGAFAKAEWLFIAPKTPTDEYNDHLGVGLDYYFPTDYEKLATATGNWGAVHNNYKGINVLCGISINFNKR